MGEIESVMSLFAFSPSDISQSPVADLMEPTQRQKTASLVNAAILRDQGHERSMYFRASTTSDL